MRIAITGATGNIGNALARQLLQTNAHEIQLLVRDASKVADLLAAGATATVGDLADPSFLTSATAGADALFLMIPPNMQVPDFPAYQQRLVSHAVAAVQTNHLPHVVLLSSVGGQQPSGTGPILGLHKAENALREVTSGLTILRPAYFMENFLWSAGSIAAQGALYNPVPGEIKIPMIATRDIAAAAATAIAGPAPATPQIVELAGPVDLSYQEVAADLSTLLGKPVAHVQVPGAAVLEALLGMGVSASMAELYVELYEGLAAGKIAYEQPATVVRTSTPFGQFAQEVLLPAITAAAPVG
ncbi:MAG: NAD(P)H azoreductase [bacterium]|nr:NAD(P)H azoreductase [bacterium]